MRRATGFLDVVILEIEYPKFRTLSFEDVRDLPDDIVMNGDFLQHAQNTIITLTCLRTISTVSIWAAELGIRPSVSSFPFSFLKIGLTLS
jgi:hypothetical protein